jgi:RNA polymerase-binding transcription factor DksA
MESDLKVRYSDEDLQAFKVIVGEKLQTAEEEISTTHRRISDLNENGFNQQGGDWYDDSGAHTDMEMLQRMLVRQQRHVQDLKNALLRIQNKTYGVCTVTGQLIDKNRLRLVPHATKSIDGKQMANSTAPREASLGAAQRDGFDVENKERPAKPVGDKIRSAKRTSSNGDDWEPNNENMEDAGYQRRKFDEGDE